MERENNLGRAGAWCRNNTNFLLLSLLMILGIIFIRNFATFDNIMNLMRRISINGIMTVGFTLTLLVGGFDLSIGATLSLAAVLCVGIENGTGSAATGMLVAISAGAAMGLLNGILMVITRGGTGEAFLITLGTSLVASSAALAYCGGLDIYGVKASWYRALGQGSLAGFPIASLIWILIMILVQFMIKKTIWGRSLVLSGANKNAAFLSGISVNRLKIAAFTMAGIFASVAAIVMTARTTAASPKSGTGADFDAAIASIIGGNSLIGGKGGMVQVFIGVVIYGLITNLLNLVGIDSVYQYIIKGAILLLTISIDNMKSR